MPEYIEREALKYKLKEEHDFIMHHPEISNRLKWYEALGYNRTLKALYNQPKADVVEVVRCEKCRHYNPSGCANGFGWCEYYNNGAIDEHYCSHGERKDVDNGK